MNTTMGSSMLVALFGAMGLGLLLAQFLSQFVR
jgi:hypothetical protein